VTLTRDRLQALLGDIVGRRVAVVGDAMLDVYLRGDVERISPEAPVPVVRVRDRRFGLGGAANVAQNVVASGAQATLVAVVGRDSAAATLRELLGERGLSSDALAEVPRPTTTKTRVVARSQQLVRLDEEEDGDLAAAELAVLAAHAERAIDAADAVVLEDYNKGVLMPPIIAAAIARARGRGIPVVVDPKFRNFFAYRGATIFKPNRRELEAALGATVDLDAAGALPAMLSRLGVEHLLLTLGERGMALVDASGQVHRIPATAREVYDVVGAGDTVTAYLACALAAGATALEAAAIANLAAGIEVGKLGAATVTRDEIVEAFTRSA
jgi:D-beta-D-heptose 7-phosphate kinase/D-beta-D-heptose 1-phosphate adenosyltransferase